MLGWLSVACVVVACRDVPEVPADSVVAAPPPVTFPVPERTFYSERDSLPSGIGALEITVLEENATVAPGQMYAPDTASCGATAMDNLPRPEGGRAPGAVVWLAGVREGKALPVQRRYSLRHEGCLLQPRVMDVTVGGTLNFLNMDRGEHTLIFRDVGSGDTLAILHQNERGQLVPMAEMLSTPRMVEVTCVQHPWTFGWVFVFDQPYHRVTDSAGVVRIDSIVPGEYELVAWHDAMHNRRTRVSVPDSGVATVEVVIGRPPPIPR